MLDAMFKKISATEIKKTYSFLSGWCLTENACDFYWQKTVGVITSVFNKPSATKDKEEYSFLGGTRLL